MKKAFLFLLIFTVVWLSAAPRFRSGVIIGAGTLPRSQLESLLLPEGEQFAEVTVRLDQGRSLSKADYALAAYPAEQTGPCLCMAVGNGPWDPALRLIPSDAKERTVRLLFPLPAGTRSIELKFLLFETGERYCTIRIPVTGKAVLP